MRFPGLNDGNGELLQHLPSVLQHFHLPSAPEISQAYVGIRESERIDTLLKNTSPELILIT